MPLCREFSPFLLGGAVRCLFGLLLTPNRFQVIFRRQVNLGDALKCWHFATPYKGESTTLSVTGRCQGRTRR